MPVVALSAGPHAEGGRAAHRRRVVAVLDAELDQPAVALEPGRRPVAELHLVVDRPPVPGASGRSRRRAGRRREDLRQAEVAEGGGGDALDLLDRRSAARGPVEPHHERAGADAGPGQRHLHPHAGPSGSSTRWVASSRVRSTRLAGPPAWHGEVGGGGRLRPR